MKNFVVRGWLLVGCGLFLIGLMGTITWRTAPAMMHPGVEIGGGTFAGTAEQAETFLSLFALVILFGALSLANGIYMLVVRRQSRAFTALTLVFAALLYALAWAIRRGLV